MYRLCCLYGGVNEYVREELIALFSRWVDILLRLDIT